MVIINLIYVFQWTPWINTKKSCLRFVSRDVNYSDLFNIIADKKNDCDKYKT